MGTEYVQAMQKIAAEQQMNEAMKAKGIAAAQAQMATQKEMLKVPAAAAKETLKVMVVAALVTLMFMYNLFSKQERQLYWGLTAVVVIGLVFTFADYVRKYGGSGAGAFY